MSTIMILFLHLSVLAYALVAGVFLAFSDFIMRSLAITSGGAEAMQAINREVFRWIFMTLFLGMAAGSVAIAVYSWISFDGLAGVLVLAAALVYLVFCFGVTVVLNVPMNEALAGMRRHPRRRGTIGFRHMFRAGRFGTRSARQRPPFQRLCF